MTIATITSVNVKQAVPFFGITNMEASLRFYVDGLGFKMKNQWIPDRAEDNPDGRIRWCWLQLGDAAIMLQEFLPERRPKETLGTGTSVSFTCEDALALYREFKSRGIQTGVAVRSVYGPSADEGAVRHAKSLTQRARGNTQRITG